MGKTTSAETKRKMRANRAAEPNTDEKKHQLNKPLQLAERLQTEQQQLWKGKKEQKKGMKKRLWKEQSMNR